VASEPPSVRTRRVLSAKETSRAPDHGCGA
jgi:hypothetical protein